MIKSGNPELYCPQNNGEKMGPVPIVFFIHIATIGTMLNFEVSKNEHGMKNITCKQTLTEVITDTG